MVMSQPQYYPQLQAVPTAYPPYNQYSAPSSDPIDQLSKVASLLDHLRNPAPSTRPQGQPSQPIQEVGTTPHTVGSTAQFQPQTQADINRQYQAMASIQSGINTTSPVLSPEQKAAVTALQNAIIALDKELMQAYQTIAELHKFVQVNQLLNQEINALDAALQSVIPFMTTSQIWMQDALQHEAVLENVCSLLTSPEFLLYWTFETFKNLRLAETDFDAIADTYLSFLQTKGKYNPNQQQQVNPFQQQYPQYQQQYPQQYQQQYPYQQPQIPFPPTPGQNVPQVNAKLQAAELMRSGNPDAAKILQRARMSGVY